MANICNKVILAEAKDQLNEYISAIREARNKCYFILGGAFAVAGLFAQIVLSKDKATNIDTLLLVSPVVLIAALIISMKSSLFPRLIQFNGNNPDDIHDLDEEGLTLLYQKKIDVNKPVLTSVIGGFNYGIIICGLWAVFFLITMSVII